MGRVSNLNYQQIAKVANSIKNNGEKPTARSVREVLGTGSMATIIKFLQEWNLDQNQYIQTIDLLDPSITRAINNVIATKIQERTDDITLQLKELQFECNALVAENAQLTEVNDNQASELLTQQKQQSEVLGRIQEIELSTISTAAALSIERQNGENSRIALAIAESRIESVPYLKEEIEKLRAEIKEANSYATLCHESAAVSEARLESELIHNTKNN